MTKRSAPRLAIAALALGAALVGAGPAQAGFTPADEVLSAPTFLSDGTAAVDAQGNSLVAWSRQTSPSSTAVQARRVTVTGEIGPVIDISDPATHSFQPSVTFTPNGRAFVAWRQNVMPTVNSAKGRWVESNGSLGPELTIAQGVAGFDSVGLQVVGSPNGVVAAVWNNDPAGKIEGRRINQDGTMPPLSPTIGSGGTGLRSVGLPDGSILSTWRGAAIQSNIWRPDNTVGTPINLSVSAGPADPKIAVDSKGTALVGWRSSLSSPFGIAGRLVGPSGAAIGPELTIDAPNAAFPASEVNIAADSAGGFIATWYRQDTGGKYVAFARRLNGSGIYAGPAQPLSASGTEATNVVPALLDGGSGAVVWSQDLGTSYLTQGRELDSLGSPVGGITDLTSRGGNTFGASSPVAGLAAFVTHNFFNPGAVTLIRYMATPQCSDSQATVVQGKPINAKLDCNGPGIESAQVVDQPKHGKLGQFSAAGPAIGYTPTPGFAGTDSFTYRAGNDGGSSASAKVTIAVGKDTVAPAITSLKFKRSGAGSSSVASAKRKKKKKPSYSFLLKYSEPAAAKVTVERPSRGVKKGKRCRARTKRAKGKRCTFYKKVGTVSAGALAQTSSTKVSGKLLKRLSRGGRFRATAIATDAAGNKSKPKRLTIRVKRVR